MYTSLFGAAEYDMLGSAPESESLDSLFGMARPQAQMEAARSSRQMVGMAAPSRGGASAPRRSSAGLFDEGTVAASDAFAYRPNLAAVNELTLPNVLPNLSDVPPIGVSGMELVIFYQASNGSWPHTAAVASALGLSLDEVARNKPAGTTLRSASVSRLVFLLNQS